MRIVFYALVGGTAAAVTYGLSYLIWRLSTKYRLYPAIRARDVHTRPTPRLGGIAMFFGVVVAMALASQFSEFSLVFAEPTKVLSVLGAALLIVIVAGLATPAIVIIYAIQESQPWWMATGATLFTLAGVAAVLHAVPRILGPRGVTGIVEARNRSATLPLLGGDDNDLRGELE
jgi:UDP-N-acetylmuramyl pentapeptide phosphotransferase/UDP-N-acetylglucosamine-1-phosphate transferase